MNEGEEGFEEDERGEGEEGEERGEEREGEDLEEGEERDLSPSLRTWQKEEKINPENERREMIRQNHLNPPLAL